MRNVTFYWFTGHTSPHLVNAWLVKLWTLSTMRWNKCNEKLLLLWQNMWSWWPNGKMPLEAVAKLRWKVDTPNPTWAWSCASQPGHHGDRWPTEKPDYTTIILHTHLWEKALVIMCWETSIGWILFLIGLLSASFVNVIVANIWLVAHFWRLLDWWLILKVSRSLGRFLQLLGGIYFMSEFFGLGKYLRAEAPQCGSFAPFSASVWFFLSVLLLGEGQLFLQKLCKNMLWATFLFSWTIPKSLRELVPNIISQSCKGYIKERCEPVGPSLFNSLFC